MSRLTHAGRTVVEQFMEHFRLDVAEALHPNYPVAPARTVPAADDWPDWHYAEEWNHYEREPDVLTPPTIVEHGQLMPEAVAE